VVAYAFLPTSPSVLGKWTLCYSIMDSCREKTSALFTRLAYGLGWNRRPDVLPLSKSLGHPAPQTSPSTSSCVSSTGDRVLIRPLPFSQFSNSQTSSFSLFSPTSPQTPSPSVPVRGTVFSMI